MTAPNLRIWAEGSGSGFNAAPGHVALGLNWEQNSTAALMIDGKIVGCVSEALSKGEERRTLPQAAIEFLLDSQGLEIGRGCGLLYIDSVGIAALTVIIPRTLSGFSF